MDLGNRWIKVCFAIELANVTGSIICFAEWSAELSCTAIWLGSTQIFGERLGKAESLASHTNDQVVMKRNSQDLASTRERPGHGTNLSAWLNIARRVVMANK